MITKKTVAAATIAVGLTASAGASYAANGSDSTASEDSATATAQRAVVKTDRLMSAAADRADARADAKRKCVSNKKIKSLRVFQPYKKVMRKLPRATYKNQSGGLRFRSFNACTSTLDTDLDVVFKKKKGNWRAYQVSVFWS